MAIHRKQLREMVTDVLLYLDPEIPFSPEAMELILLTIATESHGGTYVRQTKGPARGIIQMEPKSESDLWVWIEKTQTKELKDKLTLLHGNIQIFNRDGVVREINPNKYNLAYQIAICRMYYRRVSEALPVVIMDTWQDPSSMEKVVRPTKDSIQRIAEYWKKYYNTAAGKGVPAEAVVNYVKYAM
jgi:hypothetical protein